MCAPPGAVGVVSGTVLGLWVLSAVHCLFSMNKAWFYPTSVKKEKKGKRRGRNKEEKRTGWKGKIKVTCPQSGLQSDFKTARATQTNPISDKNKDSNI